MNRKKKIVYGIIFLVIAIFGYPVSLRSIIAVQNYRQSRQFDRNAKILIDALQKPFREDTYGGKTPEETWSLYVDAIKKRDIDLASKYFDVNHQAKQKLYLESGLNKGLWEDYVSDISTNKLQRKDSVQDFIKNDDTRAYFYYSYYDARLKKRNTVDVNFYLNPLTGVWKIVY